MSGRRPGFPSRTGPLQQTLFDPLGLLSLPHGLEFPSCRYVPFNWFGCQFR